MTAYIALPHAAEDTEDGRWVCAFPSGPMVQLTGIAPVILDCLPPQEPGLDAEQIVQLLRAEIDDVPPDASAQVAGFLEGMESHGLVRRAQEEER